jgi:hypothetical protein
MYHNGNESKKLKDRLHEGYVLFLFIFLSAIASIIVMDILVLPIAIFAVTKKEAFLLLFGDFFWMFIGTLFVFLLIRRIIALKKDGIPAKNIMLHIITKPFRAIALLLVIIASGIGLIGILYLLMSYNSYFIYKLFS